MRGYNTSAKSVNSVIRNQTQILSVFLTVTQEKDNFLEYFWPMYQEAQPQILFYYIKNHQSSIRAIISSEQ